MSSSQGAASLTPVPLMAAQPAHPPNDEDFMQPTPSASLRGQAGPAAAGEHRI
jgi:hypothetical protein